MAPIRTSKPQRESKRTSPAPIVQKRVICPECGVSLNRKTDLPRHKMRHEPDPVRYHCRYPGCDFSCLQKSGLKPHGNKHSGERTEHCPDCPESFADASSLNRHRQRMHGHQPHHTKAYLEAKANQQGAPKKSAKKNASSGAVRAEKRERRAAPYGVPAQAARGAARAKRAAKESSSAFADAELFYAPSNDVQECSPFADLSELLSCLPPLSSSSDSRSSTTSSGPGTPRELSPPPSDFWNDPAAKIMDPLMSEYPPFLAMDPVCGYEVSPTDGDWAALVQQGINCYGMITSAPTPAQNWAGADVDSQMLYNPVPAAPVPAPDTDFYSTAFQSAPVLYNGGAFQSMNYAVSEPVFDGTYDQWQYAPPPVEQLQTAASQALSELAAGMGVSEQEMAIWLDEIAQSTPAFGTL